jgi:hypothetical protein
MPTVWHSPLDQPPEFPFQPSPMKAGGAVLPAPWAPTGMTGPKGFLRQKSFNSKTTERNAQETE